MWQSVEGRGGELDPPLPDAFCEHLLITDLALARGGHGGNTSVQYEARPFAGLTPASKSVNRRANIENHANLMPFDIIGYSRYRLGDSWIRVHRLA